MFEGVFTAMVTPFLEDLSVDWEGLVQNVHFQLEKKIDGLVVLGTTGEAPTLTAVEKERIVDVAVQEVRGKVPVVVGTGGNATSSVCDQTKKAKELGADAALIVSPYYNKPSQEGLYRHFASVAETVDLPIILYNHPGRTGVSLDLETVKRLMKIPSIIAIKEATGSLSVMQEMMDFPVFSGDDALTLPAVAMGAKGVISVLSNLLPEAMRLLVRVAKEGDYERIDGLQNKLQPYFEATVLESNPVPIKAMMTACGFPAGGVRLPLCALEEKNQTRIETLVKIPLNEVVSILKRGGVNDNNVGVSSE